VCAVWYLYQGTRDGCGTHTRNPAKDCQENIQEQAASATILEQHSQRWEDDGNDQENNVASVHSEMMRMRLRLRMRMRRRCWVGGEEGSGAGFHTRRERRTTRQESNTTTGGLLSPAPHERYGSMVNGGAATPREDSLKTSATLKLNPNPWSLI
jgi:hypothetical protein